jgi:hypothetical protein
MIFFPYGWLFSLEKFAIGMPFDRANGSQEQHSIPNPSLVFLKAGMIKPNAS